MTLQQLLEELINEKLLQAVMSGKRNGSEAGKVRIRPVELKGQILYQASRTDGAKVLHKNYERDALVCYMEQAMEENYTQLQIRNAAGDGNVLVSKKGKMTVKKKRHAGDGEVPRITSHNRTKNYILKEGVPVPFLADLGVMNEKGSVHAARYDKFRQINRFLEFIEDILPRLPKEREVTILDFGCGKSYLTFAMYYYLRELKGYDVRIIGLDLKKDVIENCSRLAERYGYEKLQFIQGDVADYEGVDAVDMVVTLHACDTATDIALARAVEWGAQVILSVPCCQHEVNRQIKNEMLAPVLKYGILKERMSALLTDGIRANLLESMGYETQILEFIDMENTPKNLLIRAVRTGGQADAGPLREMMRALHVQPTLEKLLAGCEDLPAKKGE
jgi:SAM-dependent methyltransferase